MTQSQPEVLSAVFAPMAALRNLFLTPRPRQTCRGRFGPPRVWPEELYLIAARERLRSRPAPSRELPLKTELTPRQQWARLVAKSRKNKPLASNSKAYAPTG